MREIDLISVEKRGSTSALFDIMRYRDITVKSSFAPEERRFSIGGNPVTLETSGVKSVKLPPRAPNLNAHSERFVRTIKESCLERMILVGEASLQRALHEFVERYHHERNHQGLDNRLIVEKESYVSTKGAIRRRQRLGGMLSYYHRQAA